MFYRNKLEDCYEPKTFDVNEIGGAPITEEEVEAVRFLQVAVQLRVKHAEHSTVVQYGTAPQSSKVSPSHERLRAAIRHTQTPM
eukprot:8273473-Pyramimonas_sp.AAC.1